MKTHTNMRLSMEHFSIRKNKFFTLCQQREPILCLLSNKVGSLSGTNLSAGDGHFT